MTDLAQDVRRLAPWYHAFELPGAWSPTATSACAAWPAVPFLLVHDAVE